MEYRGKNKKDNKWIYGYIGKYHTILYNNINEDEYIIYNNLSSFDTDNFHFVINDLKVNKETICNFIGKYDKYGKKIYHGDIIKVNNEFIKLVNFDKDIYGVSLININTLFPHDKFQPDKLWWEEFNNAIEIIGNIFDNPELINNYENK